MIHTLTLSTRSISFHITLLIRFMALGFLFALLLLWELCLFLSSGSLCFEENRNAFMAVPCNTASGHTSAAHAWHVMLEALTSWRWKWWRLLLWVNFLITSERVPQPAVTPVPPLGLWQGNATASNTTLWPVCLMPNETRVSHWLRCGFEGAHTWARVRTP